MFKQLNRFSQNLFSKGIRDLQIRKTKLLCQKLVFKNRNASDMFLNQGLQQIQSGKNTEALQNFTNCISESTDCSEGYHYKGALLGLLGQNNESLIEINKSLELNPNQYLALYNKGTLLVQQGKKTEALECFNKSIDLNPNYYGSHYNKALLLYQMGNKENVQQSLDKSHLEETQFEQENNRYGLNKNKAVLLEELGNNLDAVESASSALELNPLFIQAYLLKREIIQKKLPLNHKYYTFSETPLNPKDQYYYLTDQAYESYEEYDDYEGSTWFKLSNAQKYYQRAIDLCPNKFELYFNDAILNPESSLESIQKAIELNPSYYKLYFCKGLLLTKHPERKEEMVQCYDKSILLNPDFFKAYFKKAVFLGQQQKFDLAIECINTVIEKDSQNKSAYEIKGVLLALQGDYNEAINQFKKCLEIDFSGYGILECLLFLYQKLGLKKEWFELFKKILSENDDSYYYGGKKYNEEMLINQNGIIQAVEEISFMKKLKELDWPPFSRENQLSGENLLQLSYSLEYNNINMMIDDFQNLFKTAQLHYQYQDYMELLKCSIKLIELDPTQQQSHFFKKEAINKIQSFQYYQYKYDYNKIFDRKIKEFEFYTKKSQVLYILDRIEEALECICKVLELNPNYLEAVKLRTGYYLHLGKFDEALQSSIEEVTLDSNFTKSINQNGQKLILEQEQQNEGLKRYNERLDYMYNCSLDNAKQCISLQQNQDSLPYINQAILLKPNDPQAQYLKQIVLQNLGYNNIS